MKYKRVIITRHGNSEVLKIIEDELPEPKIGEVRIKIIATSVAFTDILIREGLYPGMPPVPFTPGYDIVGIVDKLGAEVSNINLGQLVIAMTIIGGYAEYIFLPIKELISVPSGIDAIEAVALVLSYVTAYQMLHRVAKIKEGQRILIHGAGGAVGMALLQLGKLANLKMYGTASPAKHEFVKSFGATPIDYQNDDFVRKIQAMTGNGVDVVFDGIGGSYLWRSYQTLNSTGCLIIYGFSAAFTAKKLRFLRIGLNFAIMAILNIIPNQKLVKFYSIANDKQKHFDCFCEELNELLKLLQQNKIKPVIAEKIPLVEVARAQELIEKSVYHGKIVLLCE